MSSNRGYRVELRPNDRQRTLFLKACGAARWAYNWGIQRHDEVRSINQLPVPRVRTPNAISLHKELNQMKKTSVPWMYEVPKCAPQEALRALDRAYQTMFEDLKDKARCRGRGHQHLRMCGRRHVRYPQHKSKKRGPGSFTIYGSSVTDTHIRIPRVGSVRLKETGYAPAGTPASVTVSERAGRWFVSFHREEEMVEAARTDGPVVGIDLGLTDFAVVSDGERVQSPKPLERSLKLLRRRSRQHSRKSKGSANRRRSASRLARLHYRVTNQRRDFLHQLTTRLARTKRVVVIEDLCVAGLGNGRHSRAVHDAGWAEFRRMLEYKCRWYGSRLVVVPRNFASTKLCGACGAKNDGLTLADRHWACLACGAYHDRDLNAARNLVAWFETNGSTDSSSGIYASGDSASTVALGPRRAGSSKEEANAPRLVLGG